MDSLEKSQKCRACGAGYNGHHAWICPNIGKCTCIFEDCIYSKQNRPERSKREDLDCCEIVKDLEAVIDRYETYVIEHDNQTANKLKRVLSKSKMRCSEHCGNTVRDK